MSEFTVKRAAERLCRKVCDAAGVEWLSRLGWLRYAILAFAA